MNELRASAPGKVLIAGEYSVLFGGTSIVAAIDRHVHASFKTCDKTEVYLRMGCDLYRDEAHPLWLALTKTALNYKLSFQPGIYTIDSSRFFSNNTKLGLGSSAAATVALIKLLLQQRELDDQHLLHRLSHEAHQEFSQHRGSGADSAASSFATSLRFSHKHDVFSIEPIDLSQLWSRLILVFTGRSQNTRPLVKDALAYALRDPATLADFCATSDSLVKALSAHGELTQAIAIFEELAFLLKSFGEHAGIDIMSKEHQEICQIARTVGGSAKPSGAGGGDLSLSLVPQAKHGEFKDLIIRAGFTIVSLNLA